MLAEGHRRFERLAHLVVDAGLDQAQRVPAVERAYIQPGLGKLVLGQLDDAIRQCRLVDADQDRVGPARARRAQHVQARAIPVVDLEAEIAGGADHVDVRVDDRDVDVTRQQRLADHLPEAAEADDQYATGEARRLLDAVHRDGRARQEAIQQQHHDGREGHRQDHDGGHHGPRPRVEDARRERRGVQYERELASLREQRRTLQGFTPVGAEDPGDAVDAERLHRHERGDAGRDGLPVAGDHAQVQRHADRQEEQAEQDAAERLDVGLELVPKRRLGQQHAGDEGAHRHRQPAPLHEQRGTQHDQQRRSRHDIPAAERRDDPEQRVEGPAPHADQARKRRNRDQHREPGRPRRLHVGTVRKGQERHQRQQRNDRQVLEQQDRHRTLAGRRRGLAALVEHLHDHGRRRQHEPHGTDDGHRGRPAERQANARQQGAADQHLRQPEPEDFLAHGPQPRRPHLEPDQEQEQHDTEFRDAQDRVRITK